MYHHSPQSGWVNPNTTTNSTTTGWTVDVSFDIGYHGIGIGIQVLYLSSTQTSTSTRQNTLDWYVVQPVNTAVPICFVAYGVGGSASAGTADMIGLWAYSPTYSGGQYTCPLP